MLQCQGNKTHRQPFPRTVPLRPCPNGSMGAVTVVTRPNILASTPQGHPRVWDPSGSPKHSRGSLCCARHGTYRWCSPPPWPRARCAGMTGLTRRSRPQGLLEHALQIWDVHGVQLLHEPCCANDPTLVSISVLAFRIASACVSTQSAAAPLPTRWSAPMCRCRQ